MQWWNVVSTYGQLAQTLDGQQQGCNIKLCIQLSSCGGIDGAHARCMLGSFLDLRCFSVSGVAVVYSDFCQDGAFTFDQLTKLPHHNLPGVLETGCSSELKLQYAAVHLSWTRFYSQSETTGIGSGRSAAAAAAAAAVVCRSHSIPQGN